MTILRFPNMRDMVFADTLKAHGFPRTAVFVLRIAISMGRIQNAMLRMQIARQRRRRPAELCSVCRTNPLRFLKGEYSLCRDCYPIVKGLYTKVEIKRAIASARKVAQ